MTDTPDLSMLEPSTAEFLQLRADDFALARVLYAPDNHRHYNPDFGQDVHNLITRTRGQRRMAEINRAYNLMQVLNRFAVHACG